MDNINEVIEIKPEDIVDLYSTDKPDLIDITSLKAEENFDLADSTIDKLSAHSGTTDTALNSKPISVEHIKKENNITDLVSLDIVKQENNVPEENINVSSSHINLKQSKEASNEKLIDIVDLKEENDNSDENLNSTEKIVNLERENLKHKTTKIIERHHCSACNAIFNKASTLQYHISVRHKERGTREERSINKHGYRCPKCNFYSGNKGIFEGHTCSDEESSGSPVEKTTGQTSKFVIQLTSKGQVIKAYNKNKDTRAIDLPSPEKYEQEESVLIKAHFDGDLQFKAVKVQQILYKCPRCDYKTTEKRYFNRHRAAHLTPQQRQMFACAQCDNAYFTRGGLNHHIDNNHTNSSLTVDTVDLTIEDNKQEAQVQNGIEQKLELDIHDVELTSPEVNNQEEQVQNVIEQKLDLDTSAIDLPSTENNQQEKYVLIEEEFDGGLRFKQTRQTFACTLCDRILLTKKGLNNHLGINHTNSSLTVDTVDLTIEDNKQEAQVQNGIEQKLELDIDDVKLTSLEVSNQEEEQVQNSIEQKLELFIDDVELTSAEVNKQEEQVQNSVELDTRAVDLTSTEDNQQEKNVLMEEEFDDGLKYKKNRNRKRGRLQKKGYKCSTCGYRASKYFLLKRHEVVHLPLEKREMYSCLHCSKRYTQKINLIHHLIIVHPETMPERQKQIYRCSKCNFKSVKMSSLKRHRKIHLPDRQREIYCCAHCHLTYWSRKRITTHLYRLHRGCIPKARNKTLYMCSSCDFQTPHQVEFQLHRTAHGRTDKEKRSFTCPYCDKNFLGKTIFDHHLKYYRPCCTMAAAKEATSQCPTPSYQTSHKERFKEHMESHLQRAERQFYICPHCDKKYTRRGHFIDHIVLNLAGSTGIDDVELTSGSSVDSDDEPAQLRKRVYDCFKCKYQTTLIANLRRHMGVHLAREERELFACPLCDKEYTRKGGLHRHLKSCALRSRTAPQLGGLLQRFSCSKCHYETVSRGHFQRHMRSHLEERGQWFPCPYCCRKLSSKSSIDSHLIHCSLYSKIVPQRGVLHRCSKCNYQTTLIADLKRHMGVHLAREERELFACPHCHSEFARKSNLNCHLKRCPLSRKEKKKRTAPPPLPGGLYVCSKCNYQTTSVANLRRHMGVHLAREERELFACPSCHSKYTTKSSLHYHLERCPFFRPGQQPNKWYVCSKCLYQTSSRQQFRRHMRSHLERREKRWFACPHCSRKLSTKARLDYHIIHCPFNPRNTSDVAPNVEGKLELLSDTDGVELNTTEDSEQEEQDEKSAEQNIELLSDTDEVELNTTEDSEQEEQDEKSAEQNLELTIVQEKVHQCSSCSYRTLRKGELQKHMDTHLPPEERRLFSCLYCYKKYTRKVTVKRHIELRHIGIEKNTQAKLYKCGQCEFVGRCAIHLIRHKKVHSSEKPNCTSKFGGNYPLIRHIKRRFSGLNTNDVKRNLELDIHDVELASPEVNKQEKQVQNSIEQKLELDNDDVELTSAQVSKQAEQVQNSVDSDDNDIRAVEITSMSILRSYLLSSDNKQEKHVQNREASDEIAPNIDDVKLTSVEANKGKERVQNSVESDDKPAALRKGMYDCSKCNYQTTLMANLTGHTEMHRVREERKLLLPLRNKMYRCAKCNYQTTLMASLKQHMGTHSAREERRMSARPHCDRKCTRKDNLGHHLKSCSLHSSDSHDVELITKEDSKQDEHVQSSIASGDKLELERHNVDLITADNKQEKQVQNSTELKLKLDSHDVELITKEDNKQDERVQSSIASGDKFELESHKVDLTTEDNKQEKQVQNSTELKLKLDSRDVELITKEDNKQDEHVQSSIASGDKLELERHNVDLTTADNKQEKQVQNSTELKLKLDSHDVELIIKEDNKQDERVQSSMASGDKLELERHNVDLTTEDNKQEKQVQDSTELKLKLDIDNVELTSSEANKQTERVQNSVDSDDKPVALPIRMYSCFKCNYQTTSMASLNSHRAREERQLLALRNRTYSCSRCNTYRTTSMASLHRHIATHWAPEERQSFACPHCDNKYTNKVSLEYHLQRCHLRSSDSHDVELITKEDNKQDEHVQSSVASGDKLELAKALKESQKKIYRCCTCSYQTTYKFNFSKHKKIHLAPGERQMFACLHCDKTYIQKQSLQHHLQNNHIDSRAKALKKSHKKVYRCSMCSYQTPYKSHLNTHKNTHLPPEERQRFACLHCDKTYIQKQALQWHLKYHHTDLRAKALKELQIKVYRCSTCSYQTPSKSCLNRHNNIHLPPEERQKFACLHCNKTYIQKQALQWHLKYYHTDLSLNKGAEEKVSQRNFKTRQRKNILKPPTDRPKAKKEGKYYKCSMCNARFIYEHYLLNHLEINHCERNEATTVEVIGAKDDEDGKRVQNSEASDDKLQQYNMHKRAEKIVSRRTTVSRIDSHNPKKNGDYYKCSICKALFIYERHLLKHIKSIHSERKTDDSISTTNEENTDSFIKMEIDDCAPAVGEDMHHDSQNVECPPETNVIRSEDFMQTESDEDIQDGFYDWDIVDEPEKVRIEDILKLLQPESS
ncbi:uncharacterized protein LOC115881991 isoform X35 [Sitophilus oryzae]|uniref:Uncharacterized protein LOC115881991 isoform X35 n=1 Tax=Sitophilus oryzae TaxID=7048 RepID=A0A6J2XYB4_SITOR|nr:uncharacterized protein LOC115881991 isoform X35 [Sitophilus oryzae]